MLIIDQMIKADEEVFLKAEASDCVSPVCPERGWEINILNHSRERFSVSHTGCSD